MQLEEVELRRSRRCGCCAQQRGCGQAQAECAELRV